MNWILLSLLVAFLYAIIQLIDKFMIDQKIEKASLAASLSCFSTLTIFCLYPLLIGVNIFASCQHISIALLAGLSNSIAVILYYYTLQKEEISRFSSVMATVPIFVTILSYFLLDEIFSNFVYLGIFLIIFGSILISLKKSSTKVKLNITFLLTVMTAMGFGVKNTLIKLGSTYMDIQIVNFWLGIAAGIIAIILLIYSGIPKDKQQRKNALILYGIDLTSATTFLILAVALSRGPASLVSSLVMLKLVIIFIISIFLSKFFPKIIKEQISKKILLQKTISIILIIIGAILII